MFQLMSSLKVSIQYKKQVEAVVAEEEEERECPARYFSNGSNSGDVRLGAGARTERSQCAAVMGQLTRTSAGLSLLYYLCNRRNRLL